jgi:hypothetical protein
MLTPVVRIYRVFSFRLQGLSLFVIRLCGLSSFDLFGDV